MTPEHEHDHYLRTHRWALLATSRADGSPQVSMVAYDYDSTDIVISCRRSAAKFVNIRRDPRVVVTVADDRRYLSVAGTTALVTAGEPLAALTMRIQASLEAPDAAALQLDIDAGLETVGRVILQIAPERVVGRV